MAASASTIHLLLLLLLLLNLLNVVNSADGDGSALLKLKSSFGNKTALSSWAGDNDPCDTKSKWAGIVCTSGDITGLHLSNMDLGGFVNPEAIVRLRSLIDLRLSHNGLSGTMPPINHIEGLKFVYLDNNNFSGIIEPFFFNGMHELTKLYLNNNNFTMIIPISLANATQLTVLHLQFNSFRGKIPSLNLSHLVDFDVSFNRVEGAVPNDLANFNKSSFVGNMGLMIPGDDGMGGDYSGGDDSDGGGDAVASPGDAGDGGSGDGDGGSGAGGGRGDDGDGGSGGDGDGGSGAGGGRGGDGDGGSGAGGGRGGSGGGRGGDEDGGTGSGDGGTGSGDGGSGASGGGSGGSGGASGGGSGSGGGGSGGSGDGGSGASGGGSGGSGGASGGGGGGSGSGGGGSSSGGSGVANGGGEAAPVKPAPAKSHKMAGIYTVLVLVGCLVVVGLVSVRRRNNGFEKRRDDGFDSVPGANGRSEIRGSDFHG